MQASITTNSSNISTLTTNVANLTTLVGTMNTTLTNVASQVQNFASSAMPAPTWHKLSESPYSATENNVLPSGTTENLVLNPRYETETGFYHPASYRYDAHEDAAGNTVYHVALRGQLFGSQDVKFTNGAQLFKMPFIFRPIRQRIFTVPTLNSSGGGNGFATIQIDSGGVVHIYDVDGTGEKYMYLDSVEYWTR